MGCQLLLHLNISHPLSKGQDDQRRGYERDGVANLREPLDEGPHGLVRLLLHSVEICLHTGALVGTLEIGQELAAKLLP
jgi:hypothetical protein